MKWLRMILSVRLFLIVTVVFLSWQVWMFTRPRPRPLTAAEAGANEKAVAEAVALIQKAAPPPARIGVATLINDETGQITASLKLRLSTVSGYDVLTESPIRRFLSDVSSAVGNASNPQEVMRAGQTVGMDVVVAGRVLAIEQTNDTGRISLQAFAYDTRPGKLAVNETLTVQWTPSWTDKTAASIAGTPALLRWIVWFTVVGMLPWLTSFGVVWAMEKKSNAASLALVLAYTVIAMGLLIVLFRPALAGAGPVIKLLLALAFCTAYNYWACEKIAARSK